MVMFLNSCASYSVHGSAVYWDHWNEGAGGSSTLVDGADGKTFRSFELNGILFGKDKKGVFFEWKKVEGADPNSFRILKKIQDKYDKNESFWLCDDQHVFVWTVGAEINFSILIKASPERFKILDEAWQQCDQYWFNHDTPFVPANQEKFEILDNWIARDGTYYYFAGRPILEADYGTFQPKFFSESVSRDKNHVFQGWEVWKGKDLSVSPFRN
jgi:hypothetical protein